MRLIVVSFSRDPYPEVGIVPIRSFWAERKTSIVSKRVRSGSKAGSQSKSPTSILTAQRTLFHQPLLLAGENAAAYEQLLGAIREAVKPMDIIDEMHIADIAILQWEILRSH